MNRQKLSVCSAARRGRWRDGGGTVRRASTIALAGFACAVLPSCASERASFELRSSLNEARFDVAASGPPAGRVVYTFADENTVDVYFTDVPPTVWREWLAAAVDNDASSSRDANATDQAPGGAIVHWHIFLWPRPGKTPIDYDASNATVTAAVVATSEAGRPRAVVVYGGGGFVLPLGFTDEPGGEWFRGRTREATVRVRAVAPGAADPIVEGEAFGSVRARLDPRTASELARVMVLLSERAASSRDAASQAD
jgi:hypothetical protein